MEKFAFITWPDGGKRAIEDTWLIKKLPLSWRGLYMRRQKPYIIGTVEDGDAEEDDFNRRELGYIIYMPGFFYDMDALDQKWRNKQIDMLIRFLHENNLWTISFPFYESFLYRDEIEYIKDCGFTFLDGYMLRMSSMVKSIQHIINIIKGRLVYLNIGIWRADHDLGRLYLEMFAPYCNNITIGGENIDYLYRIGDDILKQTGLSCQVTSDMDTCIQDKNMIIMTEYCNIDKYCGNTFIVCCYPMDINRDFKRQDIKSSSVVSGLVEFPEDIIVSTSMNTWEKFFVLDAILGTISNNYKDAAWLYPYTIEGIDTIMDIFELYPLKVKGFISDAGEVSYDKFRMQYLGKKWNYS
ncbi:hypothetical protein [Xylanivirga thermophila]|uniref:hypothetical protein n=1 Tax=Xylanivirga thermophila TaxID=2496273 RepID=UPI00101C6AE1|nr:hypothetical protein [Xylanivirga thermophila]